MLHLTTTDVVSRRLAERYFEQTLEVMSTVAGSLRERIHIVFFSVMNVYIRHDALFSLHRKAPSSIGWSLPTKNIVQHMCGHYDPEGFYILIVPDLLTAVKFAKHICDWNYQFFPANHFSNANRSCAGDIG